MVNMRARASRAELAAAAQARAAGAAKQGYRTRAQGPAATRAFAPPVDSHRSTGFPATFRAKKTTYNGQELYHLRGIASVTDVRYEMWDMFGPYEEIMDGGAFDNTLAGEPDTQFLVNHKGLTMARTIPMPGKQPTLLLGMVSGPEPADNGLGMDAYLNPKRTDVSDLIIGVDDGIVTEMSFAFMLIEGWWSDDFMTFKITEVDLNRGDVSAVNYGANPFTSIGARQREILDEVRLLPAGAAHAAFRELAGRSDVGIDMLYHAYMAGMAKDRATAVTSTVGKRASIAVAVTSDEDDDDELACPDCGAPNDMDAQYCDQCGAAMSGAEPVSGAGALNAPTLTGQRTSSADAPTGRSLIHAEALLATLVND